MVRHHHFHFGEIQIFAAQRVCHAQVRRRDEVKVLSEREKFRGCAISSCEGATPQGSFFSTPIVKTLPPETHQRASGGTDVGRQMLERTVRERYFPEAETDLFHRLTKCRLKNSIAFGHESAAACGL